MKYPDKDSEKFFPFVCTQIFEKQNCFLISNDFLRKNFSKFNQMLYQYIDRGLTDSSFYRIFRIEEKVALVYYWKTDIEEPRSYRKGIYLIVGVLCNYTEFRKCPLRLSEYLDSLLRAIAQQYKSDNINKIMKKIWNEYESNFPFHDGYECSLLQHQKYLQPIYSGFGQEEHIDGFEQIKLDFQINGYSKRDSYPKYFRKACIGKCRLHICLLSSSFLDIPLFFVSEAANWMCHPWGKVDIASKEGFGEFFIEVHLNDCRMPLNISRVRLAKRFGIKFLEIKTY